MKSFIYVSALLLVAAGCQQKSPQESAEETEEPTELVDSANEELSVERVDPALDEIISTDAKLEILAEGFDWTEGPLWLENEELLIFSDIPPNTIYSWSEKQDKQVQVYLRPSGYTGEADRSGEVGSNGLLLDPLGNLVLCQHGDRRLAVMNAPLENPEAEYATIVDSYQGKKLNSPNDAVYNQAGDLYFTDPPYGLEKNMDDPSKELDFQGVYKFDSQKVLHLLTDQMSRPNGIALSMDESKLYVANSDPSKAIWMEFGIQEDGQLDQGRVFYDATAWVGKVKGLPDGLKVHPSGTIFATGPGGVWVFNEDGKHLGTIKTGQATSNCALGNNNGYLYITADMYLMRIALL